MIRICLLIVLFFSALSFVEAQDVKSKKNAKIKFSSVQVDILFQDRISIRAIVADGSTIWYAANNNRFGFYDLKKHKKFESKIMEDSLKIEFRSISKTENNIYLLSIANPALLFQISKDGKKTKLVYQEKHEKVFYDSMQFWNSKEGIAVGDPIGDRLSVLRTYDGGNTWSKLPDDQLPKLFEGEAHFAASNSNIVVKGENTWIVSGGKKSRVFYSADKGNSWSAYQTPIVEGKQMTGIFTADFYDAKKGFVSGGDYELPEQNSKNKAITTDGGKTWQLVAENTAFGFASCVQYVPNSKGKGLVSIGASGLYYSADGGVNWQQLLKDPDLYTIRFVNEVTAIAAGRDKMIRIRFK